jgi:putative colanic acid biosynthesis glycosyltransferase
MTKLSIVTINRNNLSGLKRTYESISQDLGKYELEWIVIDGNSGEETAEYLRELQGLVNWVSEPDHGIYDAMNKGLNLVSGDFVWFLNSGDLALNLADVCKYLHSSSPWQISIFDWRKDSGGKHSQSSKYLWTLFYSLPTRHQAIIYSMKSIGSLRYSLNFKVAGDFEFTARVWRNSKMNFVRFPMVICEFESGGFSAQNVQLLSAEAWRVQREIYRLPRWLCVLSKLVRMRGQLLSVGFMKKELTPNHQKKASEQCEEL